MDYLSAIQLSGMPMKQPAKYTRIRDKKCKEVERRTVLVWMKERMDTVPLIQSSAIDN